MPTRISLLRGIGKNVSPGTERKRVGKGERARKRYFNFSRMTEGQFLLYQLDWQLEMLERYYDDPLRTYEQGRNLIYQALTRGLHVGNGVGSFTGYVPEEINRVAAAIRSAKSMTAPAGKFVDRRTITKMGSLDDFEIPPIDCGPVPNFGSSQATFEAYGDCLEQNQFVELLNENLGESAHHMLYEFVSNPNAQTATVATKNVLHKLAVSKIGEITNISRSNLQLWVRNGVMYHNTVQGTAPFSPEESIEAMKRAHFEGIGELTIAGIVAILNAVIAAIAATAALVNSFKETDQQKLQNNLTGFGTPNFGPQSPDWAGFNGPGNGPGSNPDGSIIPGLELSEYENVIPFALLGAGALLLINNK